MARKTTNKVNSDGGPVFMGKVDNRGGRISGRSDKNYSTRSDDKGKYLIQIIVAIIGAIAVIIAAIIKGS